MSTSAITPWQPNPAIIQRMPQSCKQYQKWELLPTDPEVKFVQERFNQSKPHRYAIKTIYYIHNPSHPQAFESELLNIEEEKFPPRWSEEPHQEWKKKAIERWQKLVVHDNSLKQAKVLFLWHGSARCDSICSLGFTYFGKQEAGNPYGSGIYFTNSAHYASTHGHLLLAAVSMRQPYPIINDCPHPRKGSSMNLLEGKGAYQNYNAHFIPVASINSQDYYPCYRDQKPEWDEIVVFQKSQTLTRFWVELTLDTPSPLLKQPYSFSAAYTACQNGDLEQLQTWIQEDPKRLQEKGPKGETLLHAAALADQQTTLQWLAEKAPTLLKALLADTPFILKLAALPIPQTLNLLLSNGLNSQTTNTFKQTLLHIAAHAGQEENIKVLLDAGAIIDSQDHSKKTPLFLAVIQGHRSTVKLLLQRQAKVDLRSIEGETILHAAAFYGYTLIVQDLLPYKALISAQDEDGKTPLHKAVWLDPKPDIVALLLDHGANPNCCNKYQYTPLHWAAKHGHLSSAQVLLKYKADPTLLNTNGDSAIDLALRHGQDEIIHLFLGTTKRLPPINEIPQDPIKHYELRLMQAYQANLIEEQILYLEKISDYYLQKNNFIPAALILNAALALLHNNPLFERYLFSRIERIEALFLETLKIKSSPKGKITKAEQRRQELKSFRTQCEKTLKQEGFTPKLLQVLSLQFSDLLSKILSDAQTQLGPPPVKWACLGLGSMARGEMCPYSDLEFAFVIEKETTEALEYFRTLSRLIQIQIINLGETKCEIFGPLQPSPTPNGFCMDTGGNIPISGVFELIGTPQKLAQTQTSQWIDDNIILANVMNSICLIAGESKLAAQYLKKKKEVQKLQKTREKLALRLLAGHLQEFSPNLTKEKEEINAFGIKKELYRPIQEILSSLALLFKLKSTNTSKRIDELVKLKVFSSQGAANLKKAISQALDLRLEAHLFYKDETEYLYQIETGKAQDPQKLYLTPERVNTLQEIYKVLIPFCKAAQEFYFKQDKKIFSTQEFYDQGQIVQAEALKKSLQYKEAQVAYQQAVSLDPNDIDALLSLGSIEGDLGNAAEELKRAQKAFTLAKQKYGDKHPHVATSLNNIGSAIQDLGKTEEGLAYYKQALEIWQALYGDKHPDVATSLNNIGFAFKALGKTEEGLAYYKQALEIQKALYGDKHPDVALSLNNIGFTLQNLGKTEEGLVYLKQAFKIYKALYGDKHPDVAQSLNNIGATLLSLGHLSEALTACQQALKIYLEFYNTSHPSVQTAQEWIDTIQSKLQQ
jgi:ankyrin repeat protein/Tfp pilus assembly protein PilF